MPAHNFLVSSLTELVALRARTYPLNYMVSSLLLTMSPAGDQPDRVGYYTGIDEPGSPLRSLTYVITNMWPIVLSDMKATSRYSQVQRGVDRLCHYYAGLGLVPSEGHMPQRTIAVLTSTAIDESLLEIALSKLTLAPLLLSVNNSVPAVANLCKLTKATHLIYGSRFLSEAQDAQKQLAQEGFHLEIVSEKRFPLWGPGGIDDSSIKPYAPTLTPEEEWSRTAVILHSSGSVSVVIKRSWFMRMTLYFRLAFQSLYTSRIRG